MAQCAAPVVRTARRQGPRGRRARAAERKRAHLRDREAQRAQARRRLHNAYYYIAERSGAKHIASDEPRSSIVAHPHKSNFREVQKVVGPLQAD